MLYEHVFLKNKGWDRISNRKDNVKGNQIRMNLPPLQILAKLTPKRGGGSTLPSQIFSLREKKNALELGLEKSNFDGKRVGEGGYRCKSIFREERRHLKPQNQQRQAY